MQNGGTTEDFVQIRNTNNEIISEVKYLTTKDNQSIDKDGKTLFLVPTPVKPNYIDYDNKLVISEISFFDKFIEFNAFENANFNNWYLTPIIEQNNCINNNNKIIITEDNYPLFSINFNELLDINECLYLCDPSNVIQDKFCNNQLSDIPEVSYCRINYLSENFDYCYKTFNTQNILLSTYENLYSNSMKGTFEVINDKYYFIKDSQYYEISRLSPINLNNLDINYNYLIQFNDFNFSYSESANVKKILFISNIEKINIIKLTIYLQIQHLI